MRNDGKRKAHKADMPSRRGRRPLSDEYRKEIIRRFREAEPPPTVRAIAKELGVSPSTVSRVLKDERCSPGRSKGRVPESRGIEPGQAVLRDVAARAGVTVSTASLALRDSGNVSAATTQRVKQAAKDLKYQVHPHVASLMSAQRRGRTAKHSETIVYLHRAEEHPKVMHEKDVMNIPWGPRRKFQAAKAALQRRGFGLEYVPYHAGDVSPKRLSSILYHRGIQGILLDMPPSIQANDPFPHEHFYLVSFEEQTEVRSHLFAHNTFHNSLLMTCMLWQQGYRRITRVQSDASGIGNLYREDAGHHHALRYLSPEPVVTPTFYQESYTMHLAHWLEHGEWFRDRNRATEKHWLKRQDLKMLKRELYPHRQETHILRQALLELWLEEYEPDVVIAHHFATRDWLQTAGFKTPQNMGLAHYNLNEDVEGWSGIRRADEEVAVAAAEHLVDRISLGRLNQPDTPIRHLFTGNWVEGHTTLPQTHPVPDVNLQADRFIRRVLNEPLDL